MKILVVDDEKDVLDDIVMALEPTGYHFIKEQNPIKALEVYKKNRTDAVISDIRMPQMSGIDLLIKLREFDDKARVIIVTAFGDIDTAKLAINNRAYAFFGKPVNFSELIKILREIEEEVNDSKKDINYENLMDEYKKLKNAYSDLLNLVKKIDNQ